MKIPSMSLREVPKDIEIVSEDEHDTPATLFNKMVLLPNLEALEVSAINCDKIWQNQPLAISSSFQILKRLIIEECGNLEYLFSSSMIRCFLNLQHLEICRCHCLKEILVVEESEEEERKSIIFSQLNFLKLEDLENLTRFCLDHDVEFTSLKQLEIKQCPKFKAIVLKDISRDSGKGVGQRVSLELQPFFDEKVAFPNLEEMVISQLDELKTIWHNKKLPDNSFSELKSVKIEGCDKLLTLFPPNMLERISKLKSLTVSGCPHLKRYLDNEVQNLRKYIEMIQYS